MKNHMLKLIPAVVMMIVCAALLGCDNEATSDTAVIVVTGKVPIEFTWDGGVPNCPDCEIYAQVYTDERWGTFDYGPFDFNPDSITLDHVLAGLERDFTVWVTDTTSGEIIYRGVKEDVQVNANTTNDPVPITLYPRGWYEINMGYLSTDWELTDVKLAEEGYSWMAGNDLAAPSSTGITFRGLTGAWSQTSPPSVSTPNWMLTSIASGAGGEAWAVGEDKENNRGIILRYDGSFWNDDVNEEPPSSCLFGVSFSPSGSIGYAVGELNSDGVLLKYSSASGAWETTSTVSSVSLFDVVTFNNGDAIVGGKDNVSGSGYLALWDDSASSYSVYTAPSSVCSTADWEVNDVYSVSADDWWAAGACYDGASTIGVVLHKNGPGIEVQALPTYSDNWWLNGIWANSSGDAWAVGEGASSVVMLNKSNGSWEKVIPDGSSGDWDFSTVDFSPAGSPTITWGYAVGRDAAYNRGLVIKYPFPE